MDIVVLVWRTICPQPATVLQTFLTVKSKPCWLLTHFNVEYWNIIVGTRKCIPKFRYLVHVEDQELLFFFSLIKSKSGKSSSWRLRKKLKGGLFSENLKCYLVVWCMFLLISIEMRDFLAFARNCFCIWPRFVCSRRLVWNELSPLCKCRKTYSNNWIYKYIIKLCCIILFSKIQTKALKLYLKTN